jgi:hypothetical protein
MTWVLLYASFFFNALSLIIFGIFYEGVPKRSFLVSVLVGYFALAIAFYAGTIWGAASMARNAAPSAAPASPPLPWPLISLIQQPPGMTPRAHIPPPGR